MPHKALSVHPLKTTGYIVGKTLLPCRRRMV